MEDRRNVTWNVNQAKIQDAYIKLLKELGRCPTQEEVSKVSGLSRTTIKKHVVDLDFRPLESEMRALTPDVIASIYKSARSGKTGSQKLWLEVMEGWVQRKEIDLHDKRSIMDLVREYEAQQNDKG